MRIRSFLAAVVFAGSAGMAQAACSTNNLSGNWTIESDKVMCSTVQISIMGKATARCYDPAGKPATLGVTFGVDSACKLVGIADVDGRRFNVVGRVEYSTGSVRPGFLVGKFVDPKGGAWMLTGFRE